MEVAEKKQNKTRRVITELFGLARQKGGEVGLGESEKIAGFYILRILM